MPCQLAGICGGCHKNLLALDLEKMGKLALLSELASKLLAVNPPQLIQGATIGVRDRVDLTFRQREGEYELGLYAAGTQRLIDIPRCPMMSPPLEAWYLEFRRHRPPPFISKGSIRLRVSPSGERGVWLDLSHRHVAQLFEEKSWLQNLMTLSYVEIGQKRKKLALKGNALHLEKESLAAWFETPLRQQSVSLLSAVAGFTQPSFSLNKILVKQTLSLMSKTTLGHWVELGSGIGNFTLPLAEAFDQVTAIENDPWSIKALEKNLEQAGLSQNVRIIPADFRKVFSSFSFNENSWGLLVDPPCSGLGKAAQDITHLAYPPSTIAYVSCFPETFLTDAHVFLTAGYHLHSLLGVDQFPGSPHLELVAIFNK